MVLLQIIVDTHHDCVSIKILSKAEQEEIVANTLSQALDKLGEKLAREMGIYDSYLSGYYIPERD